MPKEWKSLTKVYTPGAEYPTREFTEGPPYSYFRLLKMIRQGAHNSEQVNNYLNNWLNNYRKILQFECLKPTPGFTKGQNPGFENVIGNAWGKFAFEFSINKVGYRSTIADLNCSIYFKNTYNIHHFRNLLRSVNGLSAESATRQSLEQFPENHPGASINSIHEAFEDFRYQRIITKLGQVDDLRRELATRGLPRRGSASNRSQQVIPTNNRHGFNSNFAKEVKIKKD